MQLTLMDLELGDGEAEQPTLVAVPTVDLREEGLLPGGADGLPRVGALAGEGVANGTYVLTAADCDFGFEERLQGQEPTRCDWERALKRLRKRQ